MSNLRTALNQLASSFASNVLDAIRGASLQEILAESGNSHAGRYAGPVGLPVRRGPGRPPSAGTSASSMSAPTGMKGRRRGRLARRSAGDISQIVNSIVQLLESSNEGLRAEQIRAALSLEAKELPRPIAEALASKRIVKQGQKRATTYFARGKAGAAGKSAGKGSASSAKKSAKAAGKTAKKSGRGPGRPAGSLNKGAKKTGAKRGRPAKNASAESAAASSEAST